MAISSPPSSRRPLDRGRRFTRDRLQDVLNRQAQALEKKGGRGRGLPLGRGEAPSRPGRAPAPDVRRRGDAQPRLFHLPRLRGPGPMPSTSGSGVRGFLTPNARRLFCLAGAGRSFEAAARQLREFSGLVACDNTIRKACDRHGGLMRAWQRDDPEAGRAFARAEVEVEFQTDGTSVDTVDGWREIRLSVFAKRRRGRAGDRPRRLAKRATPRPRGAGRLGRAQDERGFGPPSGVERRRDWASSGPRRSPSWPTGPGGSGTRWPGRCRGPRACSTSTTWSST